MYIEGFDVSQTMDIVTKDTWTLDVVAGGLREMGKEQKE